jgi:hypothetical protein
MGVVLATQHWEFKQLTGELMRHRTLTGVFDNAD